MKNLPIKRKIEEQLKQEGFQYPGVYKIKDRDQYLKLTSEITYSPVKIPLQDYEDAKEALEDALRCAKVYQEFIKEELYHPDTRIAICEDKGNLALIVAMPRLKVDEEAYMDYESTEKRFRNLEKKLGISLGGDLEELFNWGYDEERDRWYANDLHITYGGYKAILEIADKMKIPKTRKYESFSHAQTILDIFQSRKIPFNAP